MFSGATYEGKETGTVKIDRFTREKEKKNGLEFGAMFCKGWSREKMMRNASCFVIVFPVNDWLHSFKKR